MKHRISSLTLLLAAMTAYSQEAITGGGPTVSPQIHADHSVTFRLKAPHAGRVEVTGDFLPRRTVSSPYGDFQVHGSAPMQRQPDGTWTLTTAPLAPELYSYTFTVDSVSINDPSNVYRIRDVASVCDIFIIPGGEADLYRVDSVPHGTVSKIWYDSPALGINRRMTVYTPAGYETSGRDYPVLYLLHGMGGDEEAWPSLGRATQILDNLIARGLAEPMIVVMPNGNVSQQAAPGHGPGMMAQPTLMLPNTMDGTFEAAFPDIVRFVESTYRVRPDKASRAIAGLSMGGYHSHHISKEYPDMFDYVGLFSAAIDPRGGEDSPVYADIPGKLAAQFAARPRLYWIAIGDEDFLYDENTTLLKRLDAAGYPYVYHESAGGHVWSNWRDYLRLFVPQLFRRH